jgi:mannose-6-phosphate isomerase-like protein (cupin superfamily)
MADYTHRRIDDMEGAYGGAFKRVRAELGVSSFGIAIIDMPANFEHYPNHDHARDGQEEVFLALRGGGEIDIEGERFPLDPDHVVRVASGTWRKVLPGPDGIRVLVLGAKPGALYEAPDGSQLGAADPVAIQQPQ